MKNPLNVFEWPYRPRYYLTHPWKWFGQLGRNLRWAYQRIVRGYADIDVCDMDRYLTRIIPPMLRAMADEKVGAYPGCEPYDTWEKWQAWLRQTADTVESLQEDWAETKNEYDDAYFNMLQMSKSKDERGYTVIHFDNDNDPEVIALKEKWMNRVKELSDQQRQVTHDVFAEIAENFYNLWV